MPASKTAILKQIIRFQKVYREFNNEAGPEIVRAFQEACGDDGEVEAVGDEVVRTRAFPPLPADIHKVASAIRLLMENQIPEWQGFHCNCQTCEDTGWIVTPRGAVPCPECSKPKAKVHKISDAKHRGKAS